MAEKKNVYISLHEAFVREGIQYTDRRTGEQRSFNVARLPPDTVIDGRDVGGYEFSPLYVNPSRFRGEHWRDIPLLGRCAVTANHQIFIQADRAATYDAYFCVQDAIMAAYGGLRDRLARQRFGHGYAECSEAERQAVAAYYPMRLSEGEIEEEGGGR